MDISLKTMTNDYSKSCIILLILLIAQVYGGRSIRAQEIVHINVIGDTGEEGKGVLREKNGACFVILPYHLVERSDGGEIEVIGKGRIKNTAKYELSYEINQADIAIYRLDEPNQLECSQWAEIDNFDNLLESHISGALQFMKATGRSDLVHVNFGSPSSAYIAVRPLYPDDGIEQTMSGSALFLQGNNEKLFAGILIKSDDKKENSFVLHFDNLYNIVEPFFPDVQPRWTTVEALYRLDRAIEAKDGTNQGQIEAIETLLKREHDLTSTSLSGLNLKGALLDKGKFDHSGFNASNLQNTSGSFASFTNTSFKFAQLDYADFTDSDFSETHAPFVSAKGANFENAIVNKADFFSADLRNTNFQNASLKHSNLHFADLRGANFNGADLSGAFFTGAILDENTSFVGAKFNNTDFRGTTSTEFNLTPEQSESICRHVYGMPESRMVDGSLVWNLFLIERTEAPHESSGYKSNRFVQKQLVFRNFGSSSLPPCKPSASAFKLNYNNLYMSADRSVILWTPYLRHQGRREKFSQRVEEHARLLTEHLTTDRTFVKNDEAKKWSDELKDNSADVQLVSRPYGNVDYLLLHLLKNKFVRSDTLNWEYFALKHLEHEAKILSDHPQEYFSSFTGWDKFFPPGIARQDLPFSWVDEYKTWAQRRVRIITDEIVLRKKASKLKIDKGEPNAIRFLHGITGSYHLSAALNDIGVSLSQVMRTNIYKFQGLFYEAVYILPSPTDDYGISDQNLLELVPELNKPDRRVSEYEISFQISDMQLIEDKDVDLIENRETKKYLLIFVVPKKVRFFKDYNLVWEGPLQLP